ncbi:DNA-binding transcriptional regulator, PadR family [Flavobacterium xanthum]|uniref:DNA-binding transcriptional regulator, PadR family n=2 Tax=Flavobacterium xanthum TaxID=69322 RepID=A0A1M7FVV0_9FLAO|nr:DNA-binding transcriptional regulator, PadR family [Flavobacterium xanthum]
MKLCIRILCIFVYQYELASCLGMTKKMKNSQLYKGSLNTIIMKLLEENGKMYGYEITQKVKAITQGELNITEGALYPALHKMEAEGILDVEMEKVDNRMRKYYKLTEAGTKETVNRLSELEDFIRNMQSLVSPKPNLEF